MPDIAGKLFPNILTILAQLCATGVIYYMYRKFLHQAVVDYLDKRENFMAEEVREATRQKEEAAKLKDKQVQDYQEAKARLDVIKHDMMEDAKRQRDEIVAAGQVEVKRKEAELARQLDMEKQRLYSDVEDYVLDVAVEMNRKVLQDSEINQSSMIENLEKEMKSYDHKH